MLPSPEDLIDHIRRHAGRKTRALAGAFNVPPEEFDAFARLLIDLAVQGEALRQPDEGWAIPEETEFRVGKLRVGRGSRGGATFFPAKSDGADILRIKPGDLHDAFDGDDVLVRLLGRPPRHRRRPPGFRVNPRGEARVVEVVRRNQELIHGRLWLAQPGKDGRAAAFVSPADSRLATEIYVEDIAGAQDGEKVLVRLLDVPPFGIYPRAEVVLRVKDEASFQSDFEIIAAEFGFPVEHPAAALAEAESARPLDGDALRAEIEAGRADLRGLATFTIDPEDARDFDDAVSLEPLPDGAVRLGVHIADVSHYARPGSALDRAALERGTSIYLPGRAVHMLPERLAGGLCSLQPDVERLAKTVFLDFDAEGGLRGGQVVRSVIRSRRRFTYEEALAVLDEIDRGRGAEILPRSTYPRDRRGKERTDRAAPLPADAAEFFGTLKAMADLRDRLWARRRARGALDLDIPRLRLRVGADGAVVSLGCDERDPSHHLIEEFMLAANEFVAAYAGSSGVPILSRVHPEPKEEKLENFFFFLQRSGVRAGRKRTSRDLQRIVEETAGDPLAPVIHLALLQSLPHAEYAPHPAVHFALATATYSHFTSPIRRYPDLLLHQALDDHFDGKLRSAARRRQWDESLPGLAEAASGAEKRAEKAEREMTRLRLVRFLQPRAGEEMDALVVSIHPFGFFVRTDAEFIEGLVPLAALGDDYYVFDEDQMCLRGDHRRRAFRIGDRVRVRLAELNADFRQIGFGFIRRLGGPEVNAGMKSGTHAEKNSGKRAGRDARKRKHG